MKFRIVRVKPEKFFGGHRYHAGDSPVHVTDREKTIVDCLDRPDLSGGVTEVAKALAAGNGDLDWARLTRYLRRFGSGAVVKRLGFLVESLNLTHLPEPELVDEWTRLLTAGISQLDPSSPRKPHRIVTRWREGSTGLQGRNLPAEVLLPRTTGSRKISTSRRRAGSDGRSRSESALPAGVVRLTSLVRRITMYT